MRSRFSIAMCGAVLLVWAVAGFDGTDRPPAEGRGHPSAVASPTATVAPATEPTASTTPAPSRQGTTGTEGAEGSRAVAPAEPRPAPQASSPSTSSPAPPEPTTAPGVERTAAGGEIRRTVSTVYCVSGVTYSGDQTNAGPPRTVAVNRDNGEWARYEGTTWKVLDGPHAGLTYVVQDAGPAAHFDMWYGDRPDCKSYAGKYCSPRCPVIRVQRVG